MQGARSEAQSQKSQVANACFQKAGGAGSAGAREGRGRGRRGRARHDDDAPCFGVVLALRTRILFRQRT